MTRIRIGRRLLMGALIPCLALCLTLLGTTSVWAAPHHTSRIATASKIAWLAFDGAGARSGVNSAETIITPSTVSGLHSLWQHTLPSVVDGTLVEQPNVSTSGGVRDLLFGTSLTGTLFALDAATGAIVWQAKHPAGSCTVNNNGSPACFTTSTPAIDSRGTYVYTYGLDGYVHKHVMATGAEITTGGWPELVTLKNFDEKGSSSLNTANGYLYVTTGGYPGDGGDYQGHLVAINLFTGAQAVFNVLCSNQKVHFVEQPGTPDCGQQQAGVWARAGTTVAPDTGAVYLAVGNGDYNPGAFDYGDSVLRLGWFGGGIASGAPHDSYTPANYKTLQQQDLDLGSTAPALLPLQNASLTPAMTVIIGKDGILRLLNRRNMSGKGGPGHVGGELQDVNLSQYGEVLQQPAIWTDGNGVAWVFIVNNSGLTALTLSTDASGHSSLHVVYHNGDGGTSPLLAGGVLYVQGDGVIRALNPTTGAKLWSASIGPLHWESPLVVNGRLYVVDDNGVFTAFGL
ncbi:MAG: PQQ-binding-like beta-propeller repeat protein [Ktedonobacterales bacterium]